MKLGFIAIAMLSISLGNKVSAGKSELYATKYYIFQSNLQLNAHLFLYHKAIAAGFGKIHQDSMAHKAFKDKAELLSPKDFSALNLVLRFYRDSLLTKDLLFDSLMRDLSDQLSNNNPTKTKFRTAWQIAAFENIKSFQPYFIRLYWPAIDSANKAWLHTNKGQISLMENEIVPELERIYKTKMTEQRIRVDLGCYATWAGAYSYQDGFKHVIFSTISPGNQGQLAAEVIFHETSHFLVDKLTSQITSAARNNQLAVEQGLWHNLIFYTTGFVVEKYYKQKWQKFEPGYVQMRFQEKFPSFKKAIDGCKLYWDPYLNNQVNLETAVANLVGFVSPKK